mgnify:CR=1 FL=1
MVLLGLLWIPKNEKQRSGFSASFTNLVHVDRSFKEEVNHVATGSGAQEGPFVLEGNGLAVFAK